MAADYSSRFVAWWNLLQPSWRILPDGKYSRECEEDESWTLLAKGGSAGIYTVVVALSWWIRLLDPQDTDSQGWLIVEDFAWVLQQIQQTGKQSDKGNGKRLQSGNSSGKNKRWVQVFYVNLFNSL